MRAITLKDIWLKYRIEFKENGKAVPEDFPALKGVNLNIDKGESACIIGDNGAGKTSLLKVIGGMLKPDRGSVCTSGAVSGLMEIGMGFHKDLTGRENIYLISYLFGLNKEQIDARYEDVIKFAAIGRFINAPVKSYSQGMYMRLGFAIAIHVEPDILLIDDTFAVGDIYTQRKCINKIFELKEKGKTIVFVTHDLEMARRVCSRGIFMRDGEIIKDGPMDKVWSYYIETVGNKGGIAILQEGLLGIVFNNGRLIVRWGDNTITTDLSGHSSMLFAAREYLSTAADWQLHRLSGGRGIIAVGRWPDMPVRQYWKVILSGEKEFLWEIAVQSDEKVFPERCETRAIFINAYKSWLALDGEKDFPADFIHAEQWQCSLVGDPVNTAIGLKGENSAMPPLPTIIFDRSRDNARAMCYAGSTGSEINGRVLQYVIFPKKSNIDSVLSKYRCFLSTVRIFAAQEQERLQAYLGSMGEIMQGARVIRRDSLSIFCKDKQVEIYWKDRLLTRGMGLNTKFRYEGKNYSTAGGRWVIRQENNEEVVITVSWGPDVPFNQDLRLKLDGDEGIILEITMDTDKAAGIRSREIEMMLDQDYSRWFTPEEKGDFEALRERGNAVILNKYINEYIGVESIHEAGDLALPGIVFYCHDAVPRASYISKDKRGASNTVLRYLGIDSDILPRARIYFRGGIRVITKPQEPCLISAVYKDPHILQNNTDVLNAIELGKISLVFEYGRGRLFWEQRELTKGLGLYSSVFFEGIWYDSSQAFWEVRRLDRYKLTACGSWPRIPLAQVWELSLLDERTVSWKITKKTREAVTLEREQVNLMMSDWYKEWFVYKKTHGRFPRAFMGHNGIFWERLSCADANSTIGIKECRVQDGIFDKQSLPQVVFGCSADSNARHSIIENTDDLFQARVLQFELSPGHTQESSASEGKYFDGQIKIVI